jgi:hypothetical protein
VWIHIIWVNRFFDFLDSVSIESWIVESAGRDKFILESIIRAKWWREERSGENFSKR